MSTHAYICASISADGPVYRKKLPLDPVSCCMNNIIVLKDSFLELHGNPFNGSGQIKLSMERHTLSGKRAYLQSRLVQIITDLHSPGVFG